MPRAEASTASERTPLLAEPDHFAPEPDVEFRPEFSLNSGGGGPVLHPGDAAPLVPEPEAPISTAACLPSGSWPLASILYYLLFCILLIGQIYMVAATGGSWGAVHESMMCRYCPLTLVVVGFWVYKWFISRGEHDGKARGLIPGCILESIPAGAYVAVCRALSMLAIFFTGLAKFDFGHWYFFMLGLTSEGGCW